LFGAIRIETENRFDGFGGGGAPFIGFFFVGFDNIGGRNDGFF
jgi:hypothetical protein